MNDFDHDNLKPAAVTPEDEPPTMPLIGGIVRPDGLPEAADLDLGAIKSSNPMLNQGTMLIVGAFVIAAVLLLAMKLGVGSGGDTSANREFVQKIEQTLIQLNNRDAISPDSPFHSASIQKIRQDADAIGKIFDIDYTQKQVPIEYVKKNPFRLAIVHAATPDGPVVQVDNRALQRQRQLESEFARLKLQTVMKGRPNVAIINDEICREGQKIGSFTIARIDGLTVSLTAEGHTFTLEMDSGPRR
jgi:hypothetical protein